MEILINSFIYSNFSYCPLVWHFSSCKSTAKIEKIHKRCLRVILRIEFLATEIFKAVDKLNPSFIKNIFTSKENLANSATCRDKSLITLGQNIWNALPEKIKSEASYKKFKEYIDLWFGPKCRRYISKSLYN